MRAYIKAISYYLPEIIFSNDDFFAEFPKALQDKKNLLKTGVEKRHIVAENKTASDLAVSCAGVFFEEHKISPSEIDFLLFCSLELDYYTPSTACVIHQKINLPKHAGALDFNLGCSGYVYGLSLAKGLIEASGMKNVLLITSSTITKKIHKSDKSSRFVFGDAAAVTLISSREKQGMGNFIFGTDGNGAEKIMVKDGGAKNRITEQSYIDITDEYGNTTNSASFYMNGTATFLFGLKTVPKLIAELLEKERRDLEQIDLFVFHQANLFLIESICTKIKIPQEKVFNFMQNVGNTVSCSIPIALKEAINNGRAKQGNTVMLIGFGVGLSWGATCVTL